LTVVGGRARSILAADERGELDDGDWGDGSGGPSRGRQGACPAGRPTAQEAHAARMAGVARLLALVRAFGSLAGRPVSQLHGHRPRGERPPHDRRRERDGQHDRRGVTHCPPHAGAQEFRGAKGSRERVTGDGHLGGWKM